jgi:hypothetical protein
LRELILSDAVQRMQLRSHEQHNQVSMTYEDSLRWHPKNQNLIETAQLIADLFARLNKKESAIEITVLCAEKFRYHPMKSDQSKKQKCEISTLHADLFKNASDELLPVRLFLNLQTLKKDN